MSSGDYSEYIRQKRIHTGLILGTKKIRIEFSLRYDIYEPNKNGMGER
jgi:hypothetical protein